MRNKNIKLILCLAAMLILILDAKHAVKGAAEGIELCLYTVIPALFPYCILSMLFQGLVSGKSYVILRPLERLCNIPDGTGIIFILGILGGYPTGAICTERAGLNNKISENMSIFCNNAGPSFIFGIVSMLFPSIKTLFLIWAVQIASAIITGIILNRKMPSHQDQSPKHYHAKNLIRDACNAMMNVCSTIVLFRVLLECFNNYASGIPKEIVSIAVGMLELTNGIQALKLIETESLRLIICCGLLSFGGICVAFQTVAVSRKVKLSKYISGKFLQGLISATLAGIMIYEPYILVAIPVLMIILLSINVHKQKKAVAFLK